MTAVLRPAPSQVTSRDPDTLPVGVGALVPLELKSGYKGADNVIRHRAQVPPTTLLGRSTETLCRRISLLDRACIRHPVSRPQVMVYALLLADRYGNTAMR